MPGHTGIVHQMDTIGLRDGRMLLVSADFDSEVRRWDAATGEPIGNPIKAHPEHATVLAVLEPDGPRLWTSGSDQIVRRWDALTGDLLDEPYAGSTRCCSA
jgi:WD40 repeat protein